MDIRHPEVHVKMVGEDGNAFAILGRCSQAARRAGVDQTEIDKFMQEAQSGDYDNLLQTCMRWWNCFPAGEFCPHCGEYQEEEDYDDDEE